MSSPRGDTGTLSDQEETESIMELQKRKEQLQKKQQLLEEIHALEEAVARGPQSSERTYLELDAMRRAYPHFALAESTLRAIEEQRKMNYAERNKHFVRIFKNKVKAQKLTAGEAMIISYLLEIEKGDTTTEEGLHFLKFLMLEASEEQQIKLHNWRRWKFENGRSLTEMGAEKINNLTEPLFPTLFEEFNLAIMENGSSITGGGAHNKSLFKESKNTKRGEEKKEQRIVGGYALEVIDGRIDLTEVERAFVQQNQKLAQMEEEINRIKRTQNTNRGRRGFGRGNARGRGNNWQNTQSGQQNAFQGQQPQQQGFQYLQHQPIYGAGSRPIDFEIAGEESS